MGFFTSLIDFAGDLLESVDESYTKPMTYEDRVIYSKNEKEVQAIQYDKYLDKKYAAEDRMNRETDPVKKRKMKDMIDAGIFEFDAVFGIEK